jgi:hypothetical protein
MHTTYLVVAKSLAAVICANDRFPHLVDLDYARREHMLPGRARRSVIKAAPAPRAHSEGS